VGRAIHEGSRQNPEGVETAVYAVFLPIAKPGKKIALTTGMTTDKLNLLFPFSSAIVAEN